MQTGAGFDPVRDLILAEFERPPHVQSINLRTLSAFQRALLVIDGTVTKFIEAYTMEPVETELLEQRNETLSADHAVLEATAGTEVIARRVRLQGRYSRTVHAWASSLIVPSRLQPREQEKLRIPGESIGRILLGSRMEQYRELIWYGREHSADAPEPLRGRSPGGYLSRAYRISSGGRPLMVINERFPMADSTTPQHH
jgi:chorismate-pyruvate lyase